jgi:predicted N-acetyltransferase YhbS
MSRDALSQQQFAPRIGDISEPHVGAIVSRVEPGHYYLRNLSVSSKHRGKGIGTQFMHGLLKEHDVAGSRVTLHTARPELVKWYGSLGFEPEGEDDFGMRMTRKPREP